MMLCSFGLPSSLITDLFSPYPIGQIRLISMTEKQPGANPSRAARSSSQSRQDSTRSSWRLRYGSVLGVAPLSRISLRLTIVSASVSSTASALQRYGHRLQSNWERSAEQCQTLVSGENSDANFCRTGTPARAGISLFASHATGHAIGASPRTSAPSAVFLHDAVESCHLSTPVIIARSL